MVRILLIILMLLSVNTYAQLSSGILKTMPKTEAHATLPVLSKFFQRWEAIKGEPMPAAHKQAFIDFYDSLKVNGLHRRFMWYRGEIWPNYGGDSVTHALGLFSQFDVAFGGSTFSELGTDFNGSTNYSSTKYNPSKQIKPSNFHMSWYTGQNSTSSRPEMGCETGSGSLIRLSVGEGSAPQQAKFFGGNSSTAGVTATITTAIGFTLGSRTSTTDVQLYRNQTLLTSRTDASAGNTPNAVLRLGLYSGGTGGSFKDCRFASIGLSFNPDEAVIYARLVEQLMDVLGRGVVE